MLAIEVMRREVQRNTVSSVSDLPHARLAARGTDTHARHEAMLLTLRVLIEPAHASYVVDN